MAYNVGDIFEYVKFLTNKNQSGPIAPTDFFYAWNGEQRSYMADMLGKIRVLNPNKNAPQGLKEDASTLESLRPFNTQTTLTISVSGTATIPTNLVHALAVRINDRDCKYVNKGQIYSVINSAIDPPSIPNNIYYLTDYDTFYKFWPAASSSAVLDYIRDCRDVVYGFTPDANDVEQYNAGTSTQPEWGSLDIIAITKRTLKAFGIHFSSQEFMAYGQGAINSGN
jgi:hypothetical protein